MPSIAAKCPSGFRKRASFSPQTWRSTSRSPNSSAHPTAYQQLVRYMVTPLSKNSGDALEYCGDTLTASDAHRDQGVARRSSAQFKDRFGRDDGTGSADGVTERDSGSVRIDLLRIQIEFPNHCAGLGGERFVGLHHIHAVCRKTGLPQCVPGGG